MNTYAHVYINTAFPHSLHFFCLLVDLLSSPNTIIYPYIDSDNVHIIRSRLSAPSRFVLLRAHRPYIYHRRQACLLARISSLTHIHLHTSILLLNQQKNEVQFYVKEIN
jgi:hypothetical protein